MRTLALALVFVSSCAPKTVPMSVVPTPKFPDFMAPDVPVPFANAPVSAREERGWRFLQTGDVKNAEREFSTALKMAPAFYPAEISLGYVDLARQDPEAALARFDRAIERHQGDPAALVGRGQALLGLDRQSDALAAFEAAAAAASSLAIASRIEVLKFRLQEQQLAQARQAVRSGRLDDAIRAYKTAIAASPEGPLLYRELGDIERQKGEADAALEHFRKAILLDPSDARSLSAIGEILESRNDFDGAVDAYADALVIEPNAQVEERLERVRARAARARLPDEYRVIDAAPQITRADLAALVALRLAPLVEAGRRDAVLLIDARDSWASTWIIAVARAGIMEPFANHAFQPRAVVRRIDLAQVVSRLLARIALGNPPQAVAWESARLKFSDLAAGHLAYVAASQAVASGVMTSAADNSFHPSRAVTGAEAVEAIARLEALAGAKSGR